MPIYVYACPTCGLEVEELRPTSKIDDPVRCPVCDSDCVCGVTAFFVSLGRKEKNLTRRRPVHPPGCPCCVARRSKPALNVKNKDG